ncbi:type II toxin-antitoxin system Phd/YefM family antitoxin [Nocardia sp. NPDC050175]|uniref:type II toxin-antitoxin system Phd/YefM family antitoxin n=1 Tax=Nocardia sp. NPDC050175 TaxID=3364317 RepID=UPI0037B2FD68
MTRTISQAELRNGSAAVMDALEAGEDFVITRNGHPVGQLTPLRPELSLTTAELRQRMARFTDGPSGESVIAEIDAVFGEDRLDD